MKIKRPKGRPRMYDECAQALIDGKEQEIHCETRTEADSLIRTIKKLLPTGDGRYPQGRGSDGIYKVFLI